MKKIILLSIFYVCSSKILFASHMMGGEISYKCLSGAPNYLYELSFKFYSDCNVGFPIDPSLDLTIYTSNNTFYLDVSAPIVLDDTIPNNTYNQILQAPVGIICVKEIIYKAQISLPPQIGGYYFVYQRCCRNGQVLNLNNPFDDGITFFIDIPDTVITSCNNSPIFAQYPPTIICNNTDYTFDHSATDLDGDSLVYEICQPWAYDDGTNPAPNPSFPKPYTYETGYMTGYSWQEPMGASANLQIDSKTGMLTCHPNQTGKYVVAICVSEYKNGNLLSVNKRDFQFNVADCDTIVSCHPFVNFTVIPDSLTPHHYWAINNCSTYHPNTFIWNWGDGDTSMGTTPSHTYADSGYYTICLTVDSGGCKNTFCDSNQYIFKTGNANTMVTINVVTPNQLGIKDKQQNNFSVKLSPNPAHENFTLELNSEIRNGEIKIFNVLGENLLTEKFNNKKEIINCKNLPSGIYFYKITNEGKEVIGNGKFWREE